MIESFKEYSSGIFQKIRDAEGMHHEKLQEECQNQLEKVTRINDYLFINSIQYKRKVKSRLKI